MFCCILLLLNGIFPLRFEHDNGVTQEQLVASHGLDLIERALTQMNQDDFWHAWAESPSLDKEATHRLQSWLMCFQARVQQLFWATIDDNNLVSFRSLYLHI